MLEQELVHQLYREIGEKPPMVSVHITPEECKSCCIDDGFSLDDFGSYDSSYLYDDAKNLKRHIMSSKDMTSEEYDRDSEFSRSFGKNCPWILFSLDGSRVYVSKVKL